MSLSGGRPAGGTPEAGREGLPAFGPRLTTSRAEPPGSASTAAPASTSDASSGPSLSRAAPICVRFSVDVCSADRSGGDTGSPGRRSSLPQRAQNRASAGFCWPHLVQNTRDVRLLPVVPAGRADGTSAGGSVDGTAESFVIAEPFGANVSTGSCCVDLNRWGRWYGQ